MNCAKEFECKADLKEATLSQKEQFLRAHAGIAVAAKPHSNNSTPRDPWYWRFYIKNPHRKTWKGKKEFQSSFLGDQFILREARRRGEGVLRRCIN